MFTEADWIYTFYFCEEKDIIFGEAAPSVDSILLNSVDRLHATKAAFSFNLLQFL